jgi:hypothetical protein
MLRLLERNITSVDDRMVLLAPPGAERQASQFSDNLVVDAALHEALLHDIQRLRGSIYLADGALRPHHLNEGRHETPEDSRSWHLLALDSAGRPTGCIWYLQHPDMPDFEELRVRHAAIASTPHWASKVRAALTLDIDRARAEQVHFAEVGGWAVAKDSRLTDCLTLVLGIYGLSQMCGGAFVAATATIRHGSSAILRRLGGSPLEGAGFKIPSYFDPAYDCEMEILRFDTRKPGSKFVRLVEALKTRMSRLPVVGGAECAVGMEVGAALSAA